MPGSLIRRCRSGTLESAQGWDCRRRWRGIARQRVRCPARGGPYRRRRSRTPDLTNLPRVVGALLKDVRSWLTHRWMPEFIRSIGLRRRSSKVSIARWVALASNPEVVFEGIQGDVSDAGVRSPASSIATSSSCSRYDAGSPRCQRPRPPVPNPRSTGRCQGRRRPGDRSSPRRIFGRSPHGTRGILLVV